jgi:23S rRNA (pseudouridine1915-N3)-methyltransferase
MRLLVLGVGRTLKGPERELLERYSKRIAPLGRAQGFSAIEIKTIGESTKEQVFARRAEEAQKLNKLILPEGFLIALDEKGKAIDSLAFSRMLQTVRDDRQNAITFILGGPDGLDDLIKKKANKILSFGPMTWPHQLAMALLMEQIYRGLTLLAGHPYHRG